MTTRFLYTDLWSTITSLAKKAKRINVAVAYISEADLLPLREGDLLIVDMSIPSVRAGRTNPSEIEKYLKKGVEVHSCSNLHAKVFVFDSKAIIGSPNVSRNSRDSLIETALVTTDAIAVSSARGFIRSLRGERIGSDYVKTCKKEYSPPRYTLSKAIRSKLAPAHPTLWIQRMYDYDYTPQEKILSREGRKVAKKSIIDKHGSTVTDVVYNAKHSLAREGQEGDLVIQVWFEQGNLWAYPPAHIIKIRPYVNSVDKLSCKMIFLEEPKSPHPLSWRQFTNALKDIGITRVGEHVNRKVDNPERQHPILGQWV